MKKKAQATRVAILMGSDSDWEVMSSASKRLQSFGVAHEVKVTSAHRSPEETAQYAKRARASGLEVIIAAAGAAAHLAGVVAAHTTLPVIGVPLDATSLRGLDALLSTVQMPAGIPVATVGVGAADNAALLAARILAVNDSALAKRLDEFKAELARQVGVKNARLQAQRRSG
jgi:phosphoribosylaminoimidazole carboxylase PurE protein